MTEALSVEAVNQMRIAMGMKPIPMPGDGPVFQEAAVSDGEEQASTLESREAAGYDNWAKLQDEEKAKKERQLRKEKIKRERDAAARFAKIEGKGIAEIEDDMDMSAWLKGQSKRVKKISKQEQAEKDREAARKRAEYTAKDLAGVKVAHELEQFDEGGEQILTLKDQEIGEDSGEDELEAAELVAARKTKERLDAKKRTNVYNPNDVDENGDSTILAHYDEEIEGKKRAQFTLDGSGSTRELLAALNSGSSTKGKRVVISLDSLLEDKPVSDYKNISEIKMKKPKKSKKKTSRKKNLDDEDDLIPAPTMDIDTPITFGKSKKRSLDDANFEDDEDLQAQLAATRREALRKRKRMKPEDLAKQIREDEAAEMNGIVDTVEEDGGLLIDETSEFVQTLDPEAMAAEAAEAAKRRLKREKSTHTPATAAEEPDAEGDTAMESYANIEELEEAAARAKRATSSVARDIPTTGIDEEETLDQGLGATLNLLKKRNLVTESSNDAKATFAQKTKFLLERQKREDEAERKSRLQRQKDRESGRLNTLSAREREEYARQSNNNREAIEARGISSLFEKEYKPSFELNYYDEFKNPMGPKAAFKHLSHMFHGKGSGKQKHEKRLKKMDEEKKKEAQTSLDVSGLAGASVKNKQAGVRLQ